MARNFVNRFNHRYGEIFPEPYAFNFGEELVKVPSLDGGGKMSKSENQYATIFLSDDDELIRKKIKKAKTDMLPADPNTPKTEAIQNLFRLMELVSDKEVVKKFEEDYSTLTIRYGDLKEQLANDMIKFIAPIRQRAKDIFEDEDYLKQVMADGAAKARSSAHATMDKVKRAMGLDYF
jgi:tryptophanyl-tRNA synthetase